MPKSCVLQRQTYVLHIPKHRSLVHLNESWWVMVRMLIHHFSSWRPGHTGNLKLRNLAAESIHSNGIVTISGFVCESVLTLEGTENLRVKNGGSFLPIRIQFYWNCSTKYGSQTVMKQESMVQICLLKLCEHIVPLPTELMSWLTTFSSSVELCIEWNDEQPENKMPWGLSGPVKW